MKIYKYVSSIEAVKNICSGNIKFATLSSLNDPTELFAKVNDKKLIDSLKKKRKNGYTNEDIINLKQQEKLLDLLSPGEKVISSPNSVNQANQIIKSQIYNDIEYLKNKLRKANKIMTDNCGIFCASKLKDSFPMWAHYANNAKGFVIEFEGLETLFKGDSTGVLEELKKVKYPKKLSSITFESNSHKAFFFEKHEDWKYEKEWRIVSALSSCENKTINKGETIYIRKIPKENIRRVIFGWNIDKNEIKKLSKEIKQKNNNIKFTVAKIYEDSIRFSPYNES